MWNLTSDMGTHLKPKLGNHCPGLADEFLAFLCDPLSIAKEGGLEEGESSTGMVCPGV